MNIVRHLANDAITVVVQHYGSFPVGEREEPLLHYGPPTAVFLPADLCTGLLTVIIGVPLAVFKGEVAFGPLGKVVREFLEL